MFQIDYQLEGLLNAAQGFPCHTTRPNVGKVHDVPIRAVEPVPGSNSLR